MEMRDEEQILLMVAAELEREPTVNLHSFPLHLEFAAGVLTMEGGVEDVMAKKRALEVAAAVPGVENIVDRLRLTPAKQMQDGEIRDRVCSALLAENLLGSCSVRAVVKGKSEVIRAVGREADGSIEVEVKDGVVVLNGLVSSLSAMRLAGVLAWWVPGTRDVVNGIEVFPPEEDNDDEVVDAVRLVLEKDPFITEPQIRVRCANYVVTLEGIVKNRLQRQMAEADAWYVFRVDRVVNLLEVEE
jgi:osmotically-inducible protein OsmY